jgi:steroid delta-isomerase-like uncharacterized protein
MPTGSPLLVANSANPQQANVELMRNAFAALRRKDLDACVAFLTPDFAINLAGLPHQLRGPNAWRKNAECLFSAFPDLRIHVEDMFAADDKVAVRARFTGTHTGEFLGTQPTGKKIDYQSNELYRIVDGKITEEWICSDTLTMFTQIGAIPARHLVSMWLGGFRAWFAGGAGIVVGVLLVLLFQSVLR